MGGETARPVEIDDAVGDRERLVDVMGDQHRGDPNPGEDLPQPHLQVGADRRIERRERLVQEHHRRVHGERPTEGDALGLTAGELGGQRLGQLRDAELGEELRDPFGAEVSVVRGEATPDADILGDREPGEQVRGLRHQRGPSGVLTAVDGAALRLVETGEQPHQGGLAGAGAAEHAQGLEFLDLQVEPLQHRVGGAGEPAGHAPEGEGRHAAPPGPPALGATARIFGAARR